MDRDAFLDRLLRASELSREFAAQFVLDSLPGAYAFLVSLNCSYDRHPLVGDEIVFPDDVEKHGERVGPLTADAVTSLLWRDHKVPEWIDISVWETDQHLTFFELLCCGRYTAASERLYYRGADVAPFGIKSPAFPAHISAMSNTPTPKFSLAESRRTVLRGRQNLANK